VAVEAKYKCACCGENTLTEPDFFEKCPTCGWVDDLVQRNEPDEKCCANRMGLSEAREAYKAGKTIK
jgi:hypothetical protein